MYNLFTTSIVIFAIIQFIGAAYGREACTINVFATEQKCEFTWRSPKECVEAKDYLSKHLSCRDSFTKDSCRHTLLDCDLSKAKGVLGYRCKDIRGELTGVFAADKDGVCGPK